MLSSKRTKSFSPCQTSFPLSADIIANNEDLLTEILLHLPIKSILKFKCVSKHWLSLLSNPTFSRRRKPFVSSPSGLFLLSYYSPQNPEYQFVPLESSHSNAPFKCLTFFNDPSDIKVIQSCNGLLLCCSNRARRPFYYVYNPTTKQYTVLPRTRRVLGVALAFDASKSPHYKAVCVCKCDSLRDHYQIQIYSSNTGPWRVSGSPFTTEGYVDFNGGEFCDGAIYWFNNSDDTCLCFDVDQEQLKQVPMPQIPQNPDGWDQRNVMYFGESRGHLHFVMTYGHYDNTELDVYEMKRDYSGWFVKFRIDVDVVATAFPEMIKSSVETWGSSCYSFEIISVVQGEIDENSFSVLRIPGKVIRYDFKDKGLTKLCDVTPNGIETAEENASNFATVHVYQYIESLACV